MIRGAVLLAPLVAVAACGGGDAAATEAATTVRATVTVTKTAKGTTVVRTVTRVKTVSRVRTVTQRVGTPKSPTVEPRSKTADPRARPTGRPRFRIVLTGASSEAAPGRRWTYVVTATAVGRPTDGTAKMRVFADGALVDTIGFYAFKGELRRSHVWPRTLSGKRVILQAEVEGSGGTQRANWPLTIR